VNLPLISAGSGGKDSSWTYTSFKAALSAGFTALDTAHEYGNQDGAGKAISEVNRTSVFVETKVPGCLVDGSMLNPFKCYNETVQVFENNLELLNVSYVDLVLIHYPPLEVFVTRSCGNLTGSCQMVRAQWKAMEEFYSSGKARAIGVSNYCPSCFDCIESTKVQPMVNQLQYHVGMGPDPQGMMSYCKTKGCIVQAYGSLGNPPLDPRDPGPSHEILYGNLTTSIAKAHNKSTVQVALKYIVAQGIPTVTKSGNPVHLAEDLDLWSWELDPDEMQALQAHRLPHGSPSFACSK